jgi:hypothetical protein
VSDDTNRVTLANGVRLRVPLAPDHGTGIDSAVRTWSGDGITVLADQGPMVDPLDHHGATVRHLAGTRARIAEFDDQDTHVLAAHIADPPTTITVRYQRSDQESTARQIIDSIETG